MRSRRPCVIAWFWVRPTIWIRRWRLSIGQKRGVADDWLRRDGRLRVLSLVIPVGLVVGGIPVWQAALGYAGVVVIYWALFQAHQRVIIESFDDYVTPPGQPTESSGSEGHTDSKTPKDAGAAVLLANKLAEMRELYGFVDDPDETPAPGQAAGATVQLDDASGVLRSAVTTESKVSLGPITLPWGALMGVVARFSQAPQLRGAIHGDEKALIVTSELTRHRQPYSWRVESAVDPSTSPRKQLQNMVLDELAFQVFSDLTLQRQARWPATKHWLLALQKMAECQRRPRNRRLLLKEAADNFVHALAEDERFYLACLNLGIVYRRLAIELERDTARKSSFESAKRYRQAARRVFERAIELRPERWEAYHALADVHWTPNDPSGSLEMIPGLCDRALDRRPDRAARARILDLKAHAEEKAADRASPVERDRLIRGAVESRRRACRFILKELRRARVHRARHPEARRLDTLEKQASQCLVNLASTTWNARTPADGNGTAKDYRPTFKWVHAITRFAATLSDLDAQAHADLAEMAIKANRYETATAEWSAATRIAPGNARYAACRALTLASSGDNRAFDICERAERMIDFGDQDDQEAAEALAGAYGRLEDACREAIAPYEKRGEKTPEKLSQDLARAAAGAAATRGCLSLRKELLYALGKEDPVAGLEVRLKKCPESRDWEKARIKEALGAAILASGRERFATDEQRGRAADEHLKEALEWFLAANPNHRRVRELHAERAQALSLIPACSGEAIAQAETAVMHDPLRAGYSDALASAYESGHDLDSAVEAAETAVLLEPDVPRRYYRTARLRWELAESLADPATHDAQRSDASGEFEQALKLYESDQTDERRATCWWLARSYFAMSKFERVPPHLRFVLGSLTEGEQASAAHNLVRAAAEVWLAMTYRKLNDFHQAEEHASKAIDVATELARGKPRAKLDLRFPDEMDDPDWPLGLVLVLAHAQLASSLAARRGALSTAEDSLRAARAALERMEKNSRLSAACRQARSDYEASHGRVLLASGKPREAIAALNAAADLDPGEADIYLLLARAHASAAEIGLYEEWQGHIRAARDACARTREIGGDSHPDAVVAAELEQELVQIEAAAARHRLPDESPAEVTEDTGAELFDDSGRDREKVSRFRESMLDKKPASAAPPRERPTAKRKVEPSQEPT
jgi:hypothetical protein